MSTSVNDASTSADPHVSWPVNRPGDKYDWTPGLDAEIRARDALEIQRTGTNVLHRDFFPGGKRSLSAIAIRGFWLGLALGISSAMVLTLLYFRNNLWRAPFFIATLSVFHFLEFWTTAEYNTPAAYVSSYLFSNGRQYTIAHTVALTEAVITSCFFPEWQSRVSRPWVIIMGLLWIIVGQTVRSVAMAQAGTNFNHQVQSRKSESHKLVTHGLYSFLRHPSYFGFFWWGLGTQVALGNCVSLTGYTLALWGFFSRRIRHEEKHLVDFFGDDYVEYRRRTGVGIPFIS